MANAIFSFMSLNIGADILIPFLRIRYMAKRTPTAANGSDMLTASEMPISSLVTNGSSAPESTTRAVSLGTTKVSRNTVTHNPTTSMSRGYVSEDLSFLRSVISFCRSSADLSSIAGSDADLSPDSTIPARLSRKTPDRRMDAARERPPSTDSLNSV